MNEPDPRTPRPNPAPGDDPTPPAAPAPEIKPRSSIPSVERKPEALGGGLEGVAPAAERTAQDHQI